MFVTLAIVVVDGILGTMRGGISVCGVSCRARFIAVCPVVVGGAVGVWLLSVDMPVAVATADSMYRSVRSLWYVDL